MRDIWYEYCSVAVFTAPEQWAMLQALQYDPWKRGEGTVPVLPMAALERMQLPPAARHTLRRAGIGIHGYNQHLAWLLEEMGEQDLAWWEWSEAGTALLAAGWPYQRALDDPFLHAVMHRLFGTPSSALVGVSLTPLTFPLLVPDTDLEQRLS